MNKPPDQVDRADHAHVSPNTLLRQNPAFMPREELSEVQEKLWLLCDGLTPMSQLVPLSGYGESEMMEAVHSLREVGALLMAGESPADLEDRVAAWDARFAVSKTRRRPRRPSSLDRMYDKLPNRRLAVGTMDIEPLTAAEALAVAAPVDLAAAEKRRIIAMRRLVEVADHYEVLGVAPDASLREVKQAYRERCKEFHPDRYYQRNFGPFTEWLERIVGAIHEANQVLSDTQTRATYDARRGAIESGVGEVADIPALFHRACELDQAGDGRASLRVFAEVIAAEPTALHLARASRAAIAAGEYEVAERYAGAAAHLEPSDRSYVRLLAQVYRYQGRPEHAVLLLEKAVASETNNENLARELRRELEELRNALRATGEVPGKSSR